MMIMPPPKDPKKYEEYVRRQSESHKGKPSPRKGTHCSMESIERMKFAHKGQVSPNKGKKLSLTHRANLSKARLGKSSWNKGKKLSEQEKKHLSIMAIKRFQTSIHPFLGRTHTEETKQKIRLKAIGRKPTEETIEKLRYKRSLTTLPQKDTKPERMMQIALSLNGIKFEKHKPIKIGKHWHQIDIFIEPNLCVEVDGDYWHKRPENALRDIRVNHQLSLLGYLVIRLWESDIKKQPQTCAENIIKMIKERMEIR